MDLSLFEPCGNGNPIPSVYDAASLFRSLPGVSGDRQHANDAGQTPGGAA